MPFIDHLIAFFSFLIIAGLSCLVAWSLGLFCFPKKNSIHYSLSWPQVVFSFIILIAVEILAAPLLYYSWIYFKEGKLPDFAPHKLNLIQQGWLHVFAILITGVALLFYYFSLNQATRRSIWGVDKNFILNFIIGSLVWLVAYPIVTACGQLIAMAILFIHDGPHADQVAVKHLKNIMDSPILFYVTVMEVIMIVPMIEELIFRGFLQNFLKEKFGVAKAILMTSIVFALFHFSVGQGIDNIELIASLFILSCFLGFIRERQQSLWASIGLHSTFNAISILFLSFAGP